MEAHACRHCNNIVLDLAYAETYYTLIETALTFNTGFIKSAVQDGCVFFQWALALGDEDLPKMKLKSFLTVISQTFLP